MDFPLETRSGCNRSAAMMLSGKLGSRARPFTAASQSGACAPRAPVRVRAEGGADGGKPGTALSEDMIARLRAAEEEAARLKKQLADLQQTQQVRVWRRRCEACVGGALRVQGTLQCTMHVAAGEDGCVS